MVGTSEGKTVVDIPKVGKNIMKNILCHLDNKSLLSCRLVCHGWKKWTTLIFSKRSKDETVGCSGPNIPYIELDMLNGYFRGRSALEPGAIRNWSWTDPYGWVSLALYGDCSVIPFIMELLMSKGHCVFGMRLYLGRISLSEDDLVIFIKVLIGKCSSLQSIELQMDRFYLDDWYNEDQDEDEEDSVQDDDEEDSVQDDDEEGSVQDDDEEGSVQDDDEEGSVQDDDEEDSVQDDDEQKAIGDDLDLPKVPKFTLYYQDEDHSKEIGQLLQSLSLDQIETGNLVRLKSFHVEMNSYLSKQKLPMDIIKLFLEVSPNIEVLQTSFPRGINNFPFSEWFINTFFLESATNQWLVSLNMENVVLDEELLDFLIMTPFPKLENLKIHNIGSKELVPKLVERLESLGSTLKSFIISGPFYNKQLPASVKKYGKKYKEEGPGWDLKVPFMKELKILEVHDAVGTRLDFTTFVKDLPKLESLKLYSDSEARTTIHKSNGDYMIKLSEFMPFLHENKCWIHENVQELEFLTYSPLTLETVGEIGRIFNYFPNLKKFGIQLEVDKVVKDGEEVAWAQLLITLSKTRVRELELILSYTEVNELDFVEFENTFNQGLATTLSLFDRLQKLTLDYVSNGIKGRGRRGYEVHLNQDAITNGFLKMKELTALYLYGIDIEEEEEEAELGARFPVTKKADWQGRFGYF